MSEERAPFTPNEHPEPARIRLYPTLEQYYAETPKAKDSGERDYGVWWHDEHRNTYRVSWVYETGEIYALVVGRGGPLPDWIAWAGDRPKGSRTTGPLAVLGIIATRAEVEKLLDGWADACGNASSIYWLIG